MASFPAYDEMKQWLETNFGATYPVVDWEEIDIDMPQDGSPFIALEEGEATEDNIAMVGVRPALQEVVPFSLHLFFPSAEGHSPIRALANDIAVAGRQLQLSDDRDHAGRMRRVHPPAPGLINDGLWSSMVVNVDYTRQHRPNLERVSP